jgi:ABC-type polysaccharide transport system permease subunit
MRLKVVRELVTNRYLYLLALPALLIYVVVSYGPLPGIIIAFKNYNFRDGMWGSPWAGFSNFIFYFATDDFRRTTFNTLWINFLEWFGETVVAVLFALFINEIRQRFFKSAYQFFVFLPYFFSPIIVARVVYLIFNIDYGVANQVLHAFGVAPVKWYFEPQHWVAILVSADVWKYAGYSVVIYLATIVNMDAEMLEASAIDGANRLQQIRRIILPNLVPTVIMLALLSIGRFIFGDFPLINAVTSGHGQLIPTTDIIETFIYRAIKGAQVGGDFGVMGAVGLYQALVGMVLVLGTNALVRRLDPDSSLF